MQLSGLSRILSSPSGERVVSLFLFGGVGCVEFEKDNVPVIHYVVPALLSVFPRSLRNRWWTSGKGKWQCWHFSLLAVCKTNAHLCCIFTAFLFEVVELHHLSHDEAFLKVGVDLPCSLRSFGSFLLSHSRTMFTHHLLQDWETSTFFTKFSKPSCTHPDCPCSHLVWSRCKEVFQLQSCIACLYDFGQNTKTSREKSVLFAIFWSLVTNNHSHL